MSFLDKARRKLTEAVDKHGDKVSDGVDKAARALDEKTKGKHSDKIAGGAAKAKQALEKLDGKDDGDLGRPGGTAR
jgi:hypothetical protein